MKILFLDIDGVLVTKETQKYGISVFDPACVNELDKIICETNCKIVLSSTWRLGGLESIHDPLKNACIGKPKQLERIMSALLDKTPIDEKNMNRGVEIRQWITDNKFSGAFAIVDDDSFDIRGFSDNLVLTSFDTGLTKKESDTIINILKRG